MSEDFQSSDYPLYAIVKSWLKTLKRATDFKQKHFQDDANECMKFLKGGSELSELLWGTKSKAARMRGEDPDGDIEELPAPTFRMVINKASEVVQIYGPVLYDRNPKITATPITLDVPNDLLIATIPPDQMQQMQMQMQAQQAGQQFDPNTLFPQTTDDPVNRLVARVMEYLLDFIQRVNDKKLHGRRAIDEALIKGASILLTTMKDSYPGGPQIPVTEYDSIDNWLLDPDAETWESGKWIAQKCRHPLWEVEKEYGYKPGELKEEVQKNGDKMDVGDFDTEMEVTSERAGQTSEMFVYWKIWSKLGVGDRLKGTPKELQKTLADWGDYVYIVIGEGVPWPLNMPQHEIVDHVTSDFTSPEEEQGSADKLFTKMQWPLPTWAVNRWPCELVYFHDVPNNPYPMSHLKPGMGQLKFLNWAMSFLANKVRQACKTVVAVVKAAGEELKTQLLSGRDYSIVEIENALGKSIGDLVSFLEMPPFHGDVYKVIEAVAQDFEKATGLNEAAYGNPGGMRSAQEANIKEKNRSVRPDDMANRVEDILGRVAEKEAFAAVYFMNDKELEPILGQRGAQVWAQYIQPNIETIIRKFHIRIEAGTARKPNKQTQQDNMNQAMQVLIQPLFAHAQQTGDINPINNLFTDWCAAMDLEDHYNFTPPPPQPNPQQLQQQQMEQEQINAEHERAGEMHARAQELQMKTQEHELDMQHKQQSNAQDLQLQAQTNQVKAQLAQSLAMQKMLSNPLVGQSPVQQMPPQGAV